MTRLHEHVETRLRSVGQRYTPKRRALVEALERAGNPVTIGELADGARGLPQSSVYRNLALLEQAGAVHRVVTDEDFARYELAEDLTEHHHHLVCGTCGRVEDVTVPSTLERSLVDTLEGIADQAGFATIRHRLDLIGTCASCRAEAGRRSPSATA